MGVDTASIAANLETVRERIARGAHRAGRKPEEITLVAVSKTFPAESIRLAYAAGVRHFGENRVQEWEKKQPLLADLEATWHLVGHLQSNKAARGARLFRSIDTLDSLHLAQKLDHALAPAAARLTVLIEVRLAPEETKNGANEAGLPALTEAVLRLPHLDLRGLMCIPPYFDDPQQARPYFRRLRELRDALRLPELSMGMSHDFDVAIEEGATQVRLGTAIFGPRLAAND
ncbi:MAG TPA: YggS family pyridoxal phosphate-dependent enzyme [Candidatus Acidoferrales bacterium]|jgi:pyridoxal phosphate enzyme (YggS family)|nr:YggS family pyridoxal phosphate-dependent enzyme [Candidatus Acidoferrales bacterium]